MAIDAHWGSVKLLMKGDGTNGSTTFVDHSQYGRVPTAVGSATISTTDPYDGTGSLRLSTTGFISIPSNNGLCALTGDFTIEMWIKCDAWPGGGGFVVLDARTNAGTGAHFVLGLTATGQMNLFTGSNYNSTAPAISPFGGGWTHLAWSRVGSTMYCFMGGVLLSSYTFAGALSGTTTTPMYLGSKDGVSYNMSGYLDLVRITVGVGRYTADYDPASIAYESAGAGVTAPTPSLIAYAGGQSVISVPAPFLYMGDRIAGDIAVTIPSPVVSFGVGAGVNLTIPRPRLNFTAHGSYGDNAAFVKPPKITVSAYGGGRAALTAPSPNLTSTATGTALAVANLTAPSPTVEALGTVSNVANISITIPGPNVLAYAGSVCSVTIGGVTVQATGTGGGVAHAAITIPLFQLDAQGTAQNHGGANIFAPMPVISTGGVAHITIPMATLTVIGTATVTATYEAYALNLKHNSETNDEVTHYTNFPFTHIVRYKDRYYGASSTGLYLLEGTTDDGAAIEWAFKTGMTDFDSPQLKTVTYAYFGGRMGPDATVSIYPSEPSGNSYSYTTPRGQTAQNYRQQFGKGLKARYYAIGASGSDALELDSLDLTIATLTRRI